tara:strand:+ start:46 stop:498 length:453 start_codon:yes stop_codon:yes gene_type:complete
MGSSDLNENSRDLTLDKKVNKDIYELTLKKPTGMVLMEKTTNMPHSVVVQRIERGGSAWNNRCKKRSKHKSCISIGDQVMKVREKGNNDLIDASNLGYQEIMRAIHSDDNEMKLEMMRLKNGGKKRTKRRRTKTKRTKRRKSKRRRSIKK